MYLVDVASFRQFYPPPSPSGQAFKILAICSNDLFQQDAHRLSVLGAGLSAPICLFPTCNLGEFLEFANLGLNVDRKDLDCEVQKLGTKSVLGTCTLLLY